MSNSSQSNKILFYVKFDITLDSGSRRYMVRSYAIKLERVKKERNKEEKKTNGKKPFRCVTDRKAILHNWNCSLNQVNYSHKC